MQHKPQQQQLIQPAVHYPLRADKFQTRLQDLAQRSVVNTNTSAEKSLVIVVKLPMDLLTELTKHVGMKVRCAAQYRKEPRSTELTTGGGAQTVTF